MAKQSRKVEGNGENTGENAANDFSAALAALAPLPTEIGDNAVNLPRPHVAGMVMDDNVALAVDTFLVRQFTNNQNALAKARAEKYSAATTDEDRAKYAPLTVDEILSRWKEYEWTGGGGIKVSAQEQMRNDAAWSAWVNMVAEHNAAIGAGGSGVPVIVKLGKLRWEIPAKPRKAKDASKESHEAAVTAWQADRDNVISRMRSNPDYAERVQKELDRIMAEAGATKASETDKENLATGNAADFI